MPQGARGHIGIKKETTWGQKVAGDNDVFLPFESETLTAKIEEILSAAPRGILDEPRSYPGEKSFDGDIVLQCHPASIGHILRSALNVPAGAVAAGTTETEFCDCETVWEHDEGVITSLDPNDKKKGSNSSKIQVTLQVAANDVLASRIISFNFASPATTHYKFWMKSSIALDAADLALVVSEQALGAEGASFDLVNIPAMAVPGQWYEHTIAISDISDMETAISVAIKMLVDKGEFEFRVDDFRAVVAGSAGNAKKHVFTPRQATDFHADCPINPYTLEIYRDQGNAFQFLGAIVNTLTLSFSTTDKILKATCGIIAKNLGGVSATALSLETTLPFLWKDAVISIGGSPNNDLSDFSITWDNLCVAKYTLNNTDIPAKIIRDGYRTTPVSFIIDFEDRTEYDYFIAGTERSFQVKLEGALCDDPVKYTFQLDMPLVRYLTYPINIGGPGKLTCAVTGKAKYDAAGYALLATLINLESSY